MGEGQRRPSSPGDVESPQQSEAYKVRKSDEYSRFGAPSAEWCLDATGILGTKD